MAGEVEGEVSVVEEESEALATGTEAETLSQERYAELGALEQIILTISENGYGKRTNSEEFPLYGRGGQGVIGMQTSERNGKLVGAVQVSEGDEIMLISDRGTLVRTRVDEVSVLSRNTQGVRLIKLKSEEKLVGLERIEEPDDSGQPAVDIADSAEVADSQDTPEA